MSPIVLLPSLGPDGTLRWHIRGQEGVATVVADTGYVYRDSLKHSEALEAVIGAISEWYKIDRQDYDGLNIEKVKHTLYEKDKI